MFVVNFWTFAKKINSTELPVPPGTAIQCDLKEDTTITTPILKIAAGVTRPLYNYAYITEFGRYYWIVDWEWIGGLWYCFLRCDVLSTYRSAIGNTTCYVLRSSADSDGDIMDTLYPTTSNIQVVSEQVTDLPWTANGYYIVNVLGGSGSFYAMDAANLTRFFTYLFSDDYLQSVVGPTVDLDEFPELKVQLNPLQYIGSIVYVPVEVQGGLVTDILVGRAGVFGITAYHMDNYIENVGFQVPAVPTHPQSGSRGNYLNYPPYTRHTLNFPPFGSIDLPSDLIQPGRNASGIIAYDIRTGDSVLELYSTMSGDLTVLARVCAPIGVDVLQSRAVSKGYAVMRGALSNTAGQLNSLAGGAGAVSGASSGNMGLDIAGNALRGGASIASFIDSFFYKPAGDMASSRIPAVTSVGSSGSAAEMEGVPMITSVFSYVTGEHNASMGRPLHESRVIASIPGFILCQTAPVEVTGATDSEIGAIKHYMTGGFYYE